MIERFEAVLNNAEMEIDYAKDYAQQLKIETETRKLWRAWSGLLQHYVLAVSAMRTASNGGSDKLWSDRLLSEQKSVPSLLYAFQARNAEKHALENARDVQPRSSSVQGLITISGDIDNLKMHDNYSIDEYGNKCLLPAGDAKFIDGRMVEGTIDRSALEEHDHFIRLSAVTNRGVKFPVPDMGIPAEGAAIQIATDIVEWLEKKYAELKELASNV